MGAGGVAEKGSGVRVSEGLVPGGSVGAGAGGTPAGIAGPPAGSIWRPFVTLTTPRTERTVSSIFCFSSALWTGPASVTIPFVTSTDTAVSVESLTSEARRALMDVLILASSD